ncbi:hypothetical protein XA68_16101 [Ophiocordyceps unilateralis]|uniref:ferric-chelate reductase (NADPH) n=1 Tax=Ophiocordyceps unilateralis TaxID=268505 RepID=A0A2A9P5E8_OPHUN|nr:hypothetical protein XA68_16101 [Ophiocordyceps unilateralis]
MGVVVVVRIWHLWQDKIRQAIYKHEVEEHYRGLYAASPSQQHGYFPDGPGLGHKQFRPRAHFSSVGWVNDTLALFRWIFYRPIPDVVWRKHRFTSSSLAVLACASVAVAMVTLYCFLQQPLYWQSIRFGSPPVAIRAGMLAVAMTPWIVATSMKANLLTLIVGIGPDRLNVVHRWLGYLCLLLVLVHMVPFYVQPVWQDGGMSVFNQLFPDGSGFIYGTGVACFVPLAWLCLASLPWIRRAMFEAFVVLHVPAGIAYVGLLFWHTKNYLLSWSYLYATVAIWAACYLARFLFKLNWSRPGRMSFLVGDEAAITLLADNAIKLTIPTQMRWRPGQYVYLRMPAISLLGNHPFTIASLCSDDFPSDYGDNYRDCVLVFKPYRGFTQRLLQTAISKGPLHTYRAFLDGPYGGMRRELAAFDTCILIAGGSGITSLMSQLLNLVKRMRDGKAITRKVMVVWALKRFEAMDWFREELRICQESAPPESVVCKFFLTSAVRHRPNADELPMTMAEDHQHNPRALNHMLHDKLDGFVAGIASKRNSALIMAEAQGDAERERELRAEDEDRITALPHQRYLQPQTQHQHASQLPATRAFSGDVQHDDADNAAGVDTEPLPVQAPELAHLRHVDDDQAGKRRPVSTFGPPAGFDFGFPETPTEFQKSLVRFAFPIPHQMDGGWTIEYGRPQLGHMLREWATGGPDGRGILGRRTAVFVCGPPSMREGVANTVARLQAAIWGDDELEELFLHTENFAL